MALKVKTLNDPNTGDQIAPRTLVEAIVDRDGVNLGSTLEGLDTNKASNADLDVVNKRISNLVANTGEQTEGNAELIDIRVGADGIQYETAGDAVRNQFSLLSSELKELGFRTGNLFNRETVTNGFIINNNGEEEEHKTHCYSDYIPVKAGQTYCISYGVSSPGGLYNENKEYIGKPYSSGGVLDYKSFHEGRKSRNSLVTSCF